MIRTIPLILLCIPLAGCDWLAVAASFYAPVVEPECTTDVFRVSRCVDGHIRDWSY